MSIDHVIAQTDNTKKSARKVLLVISPTMQTFQTRHEVQKNGKGYCAGTRVALNSGATYAVGIRMGVEQFFSKVTLVNFMPSPVAQEEYDIIVIAQLDSDSTASYVSFYSQLAQSNNTVVGGKDLTTIQTEDAKYYSLKTELFPQFTIKIRGRGMSETIHSPWIVPAENSMVGTCTNIVAAMQATLNNARTAIAKELYTVLRDYERTMIDRKQ